MTETPLYINSILNYVVNENQTLQDQIEKYYVKPKSFDLLKYSIEQGTKFVNFVGLAGTGKTTTAYVLSNQLTNTNKKISFLKSGKKIDLRKKIDILFIDDVYLIKKERLKEILESKRIKQFVVLSQRILDYVGIDFKVISLDTLNRAEVRELINKRLNDYDEETSSIVFESILKNKELLDQQNSPKAIFKFLSSSYSNISKRVEEKNDSIPQKNKKVTIPLSSIIGILISIMLFLLTQRNSKISANKIIQEFNEHQQELIEIIEKGILEVDLDLCYLVSMDLNIRELPRLKGSKIIHTASKNSLLKVIEKRNKWWYIETQNINDNCLINGWVNSDYLIPFHEKQIRQ